MIEAFVKIRLKQVYRGLIGIGLIRTIFLIGLLGFIAAFLFIQTSKYTNSFYVAGIVALIVFWVHSKREDKSFLKINFKNDKLICFVEYIILTSIVIAFLVFHFQWFPLLVLLSVLYLIINLDLETRQYHLNTKIQLLIPSECFEWKGGVRQTLLILIPLWIIGLCTSFFIGSVPIVLFILGIIPFNFYEKGEPYQMILAYELGTNRFLFHKIKMLILYIYLILTKYAFYESNSKSPAAQVFGAIGAVGGIIPVFLPVVWLLSIRFYFKSQENLKLYLNDYN